MFNSSIILVLGVLLVIGSAVYYKYRESQKEVKDVKEGFTTAGSGDLTTRPETTYVLPNGKHVSGHNNANVFHLKSGSDTPAFLQYPSLQSQLAPRNIGGINIKSNLAKNLDIAVPGDPKTLGQTMCSCAGGKCSGNCMSGQDLSGLGEIVGSGSKEGFEQGANGGELIQSQPLIYDRNITSISRSRLHGLGDPIRGDLHIVPENHSGWFQVSATPAQSLRVGAMHVIGGATNENARLVAKLKQISKGGRSADPYEEIESNDIYKQLSA